MSKSTRLIGIVIALATLTTSADPLWPSREAKSLAKPEPGKLTEDGKSEKQILAERKILAANMAEHAVGLLPFRDHEFQVSVAGGVTVPNLKSLDAFDDHKAGASLGVNYFLTRNLGLGIEARHVVSRHENFFNQMALNGIFRLPFDTIAPYAIVGVGYRYQDHDIDFRASYGAGIEWRPLSPQWGIFTDWRAITTNFKSLDDGGHVGRLGIVWSY
jgi:hypothetical protein